VLPARQHVSSHCCCNSRQTDYESEKARQFTGTHAATIGAQGNQAEQPTGLVLLTTDHPTHEEEDMAIEAINTRNQFRGRIKEIVPGPVLSEVDVETPAGIVTSVITSRSIADLKLKIGSDVLALVKSTEVSIAKL
jgi:molybdopterin-binding protein